MTIEDLHTQLKELGFEPWSRCLTKQFQLIWLLIF